MRDLLTVGLPTFWEKQKAAGCTGKPPSDLLTHTAHAETNYKVKYIPRKIVYFPFTHSQGIAAYFADVTVIKKK